MVLDGIDKFNLFSAEQLIIMSTEVNQRCGVNNCRELHVRVRAMSVPIPIQIHLS